MSINLILEALVMLGAIAMGTRAVGVGVGLWGGLASQTASAMSGLRPGLAAPLEAIRSDVCVA